MSEYSNSQIFPQFGPHSNSELIAQREMEKVSSPPAILLLLYFYFQWNSETNSKKLLLSRNEKTKNCKSTAVKTFMCFFLFRHFCLGKDLPTGRERNILWWRNITFRAKHICLGKDLVRVGVGEGGGEIFGGIISDISLHFVPRPLASAKFKITPFFTVDGETGTLKQGFWYFSVSGWNDSPRPPNVLVV